MTYIKKLVLQGFKSFNRKIAIPFTPTFSVICGPNGSGKSNLNDAVCFVLGRTSAKALRAGKLQELIFYGAGNKPSGKYAKVSLYLDNSKKEFPVEEDVVISRKVNQNGISVYRLNGIIANRREILDLLGGARIFPDGHNMVLQGDVTNIIEMTPLERRGIIDNISGIAEYDEKKEKAEKEFAKVEQKLKEVGIILSEREETYEKLKEERENAIKYQNLNSELKRLRAGVAHTKFVSADETFKTVSKQIEDEEKNSMDMDEKINLLDAHLEEKEKELDKFLKAVFEQTKDIAIIKEAEEIKTNILRKKDKIEFNKREIERLKTMMDRLESISETYQTSIAVNEILKLRRKDVAGIISNLCKVSPKYQTAIKIVAGHHMQDIVVLDERTAIECVKYLKENKIGRATFLPLDKIQAKHPSFEISKKEGVIGWANKLIDFDTKYKEAFDFIFGSTLVVKGIDDARSVGIGNVRMVTLDGDLLEKSGAVIGGYLKIKSAYKYSELEEYKKTKETLEREIESLRKEIEKLNEMIISKTKNEEIGYKKITYSEKEKDELENELNKIKRERQKLYQERLKSQGIINKLKINRARTEAELENSKIEFEQYKDEKQFLKKDVSEMESRIRDAIREIEQLGPVNMKAIEEFDQFKDDFNEMKEKFDKVIKERDAIVKMIERIESRKKETFMKTFNEIAKHFSEIFKDMAHGNAELTLEEEGNIYSGMDIRASPNRKKLMNIDGMSGGEKSLTALAFLFAIQQYKPAPFYVLDEIDAALDKANSKKVGELIRKFSKNSQFIVVTHNDTTVQMADQVYGVSMEDGESKIIGINMPEK